LTADNATKERQFVSCPPVRACRGENYFKAVVCTCVEYRSV
jgi:hypothetical protein